MLKIVFTTSQYNLSVTRQLLPSNIDLLLITSNQYAPTCRVLYSEKLAGFNDAAVFFVIT